MSLMPGCPPVPEDADPEVIALEEKGREPLTLVEFNQWVLQSGNPYPSGKATVQHLFTEHKIEKWFSDQPEESVKCPISVDPITFNTFRACAAKHPPTKEDVPGIDTDTAKAIIDIFGRCFLFSSYECGKCGKTSPEKTCSACNWMKYCSRECQRAHWKEHKKWCKLLSGEGNN